MEKQTLSYPIGEYQPAESISSGQKQEWINALEHAPAKLKQAVRAMSDSQLDTPYREGGMDCPPSGSPSGGQPHERLYPV